MSQNVGKFRVEKSGVEKFMVEKYRVQKPGVEKFMVEKSGVGMSCNHNTYKPNIVQVEFKF